MSLKITGKKYFVNLLIESLTVGATINSFHKSSGISYFSITSLLSKIHKDSQHWTRGQKNPPHYPKDEEVWNQNISFLCSFCMCFGIYILWYHIYFYQLYSICNENNCTNSHTYMLELFSSSLCLGASLKASRPEMLSAAIQSSQISLQYLFIRKRTLNF